MGRAPLFFRLFPASFRRRVRASLRPYATRFFEAYLDDYVAKNHRLGTHPELASSAMHIPVASKQPDTDGAWGYMLPKAEPGARTWSDGLPIPPQHLWHG